MRLCVRPSAGPGVPQTCANRILGVQKNLLPSSKFLSARVSGRPDGLQTCANSILNPFQNQVCRRLKLHALASEAGRAASRRAQTTFSERLRMEFVNVCGLKMNARISTKIAFVDACRAFILAHRRDAGTRKLSGFVDGCGPLFFDAWDAPGVQKTILPSSKKWNARASAWPIGQQASANSIWKAFQNQDYRRLRL